MRKLVPWLASIGAVTVIFGTIYGVAQLNLRETVNNVPAQIADDAATRFNSSTKKAFSVIPGAQDVEIAHDLAPFYVLYDRDGQPIGGNGYLHGTLPTVPFGVLTHATAKHDNTVTWQPEASVRATIVVAKLNNGYILAGQSLRLTERQEEHVLWITAVGWVMTVAGLGFSYLLTRGGTTRKR